MWGFFESFALVSDVDRMMVDVHSRRHSRDFLRLLKCIENLNIGEEQGICSIHEFELFVHSGREILILTQNCSTRSWKIAYEGLHLRETHGRKS